MNPRVVADEYRWANTTCYPQSDDETVDKQMTSHDRATQKTIMQGQYPGKHDALQKVRA
jgi:hypothetical protein